MGSDSVSFPLSPRKCNVRTWILINTCWQRVDKRVTEQHTLLSLFRQAHMEARRYLELLIAKEFTRVDGSTVLYVARESVFPGLSAWPIPHDAPYKQNIDRSIMAVREVGWWLINNFQLWKYSRWIWRPKFFCRWKFPIPPFYLGRSLWEMEYGLHQWSKEGEYSETARTGTGRTGGAGRGD